MSAKIKLATLSALLIALSAPAFAQQTYFPAFPSATEYQSNKAIDHSKAKRPSARVYVPSDAYGSAVRNSVPTVGHRNSNNNINPDFQSRGDW
jgi:hypothetical protein